MWGWAQYCLKNYDCSKHVVAYASRSLSKAEKDYCATEKEALGLVWGVHQFRPYLYGRNFLLISDHFLITWLKSIKEPRGRLARWTVTLSEYEYDIQHKPGRDHTIADGLS